MDEIAGPRMSPALHAPEASVIDNARIRAPGRPSFEAARYGAFALLGSLWACAASPTTVRAPYQTNQFIGPPFTCAVPAQEAATLEDPAAQFERYVAPIFVAAQGPGVESKLDLRADHVCKLKTALALRHVPAERRIDVLYAILAATAESLATTECEEFVVLESNAAPRVLPQFDYEKCARLGDARVLAAETIAASRLLEQDPIWSWVLNANLRSWIGSGGDGWITAEQLDAHVLSTLHPYFHEILRGHLGSAGVPVEPERRLKAEKVLASWIEHASSLKLHGVGDLASVELLRARLFTVLQLAAAAGLQHEAISLIQAIAVVSVENTPESANSVARHLRGKEIFFERCNEPSDNELAYFLIQHLILRLSVLDIDVAGQLKHEICADAALFKAFLTLATLAEWDRRYIQPAIEVLSAHGAVLAATTFASHENPELAISSIRLIVSAARDVSRTLTEAQRGWIAYRLLAVITEIHSGPQPQVVSESATWHTIYVSALCQTLSALNAAPICL